MPLNLFWFIQLKDKLGCYSGWGTKKAVLNSERPFRMRLSSAWVQIDGMSGLAVEEFESHFVQGGVPFSSGIGGFEMVQSVVRVRGRFLIRIFPRPRLI